MFLSLGNRSHQRLGKAVILPVSVHVGLLILFDLNARMEVTLLLVGMGFLGVFLAERLLQGQSWSLLLWPVLVVAAVLRSLLLPLPPTLSEDVHRYVWDGRVLTGGFNPYELPPDAVELFALRDGLWEGLPHRQVPTVYPPLAQALFALSSWLPASVLGLKAILVLLDLGTCALLLWLTRIWSLPPARVVWYAWNPLVTLEVAGMGHVDALGVALVVLATALLAAHPRQVGGASLAAAGAVLTKLIPILAAPVWIRQSGRRGRFVSLTLAMILVGLSPMVIGSGGVPPGLVEYGVSWEFNGPIFEPLWRSLDRSNWQSLVESGLDSLKETSGRHGFWNRFYQFNYPQLWAKTILSVGLVGMMIWSWRTANIARALRRVFGSVLLFSATVYPWYALWVLPWAALTRQPAWLVLSGSLFFSYIPRAWGVPLFPWIQALIWVPFVIVLSMRSRWFTR